MFRAGVWPGDERSAAVSGGEETFTVQMTGPESGTYLVRLVGDLDVLSTDALVRAIAGLEGVPPLRVVVDLREMTFIDSSGIKALVDVARSVEGRGGTAVFAEPTAHVDQLFRIVELAQVIEIQASVDVARARIARADAGEVGGAG